MMPPTIYLVNETIYSLRGERIKVIPSNGLGILIFRKIPIFKTVPMSKRRENTIMVFSACHALAWVSIGRQL